MKKYLLILAFSCLTLCSCDNFLDLTPQSVLTPENAYEKPEVWQTWRADSIRHHTLMQRYAQFKALYLNELHYRQH